MRQTPSNSDPSTQDIPVAQYRLDNYTADDIPESVKDRIEDRFKEIIEDTTDSNVESFNWQTGSQGDISQARLDSEGFDYIYATENQKKSFGEAVIYIFNDKDLDLHGVDMKVSPNDTRPDNKIINLIEQEREA
jgi:hypothetical protein